MVDRRTWRGAIGLASIIAVTCTALVATPASATEAETPYIIQVPQSQTDELLDELSDLGVSADEIFDDALNGVAVSLTPDELSTVTDAVSGDSVAVDRPVDLMATQSSAPWNLSMLDAASRPADSSYQYPDSAGAGVRVYVIDTGIATNNPQLAGRVLPGVSVRADYPSTTDCHGHGTHVAGTIASTTYGVAKNAYVIPIRMFGCTGSGWLSDAITGIDWAIADKPAGTTAVINMSIGSSCFGPCSPSDPMLVAVQRAVDAGFVVAVAAGNSAANACSASPAAAPAALTVGAIDEADQETFFSNHGPCVDLYAPGMDIRSLDFANPTGYADMSGTSMASPHVAGAAALYIAANPSASATEVASAIKAASLTGAMIPYASGRGSPNAELSTTAFLAPGSPESFGLSIQTNGTVTASWAAAPGNPASDYTISYRVAGTTTWQTYPDGVSTSTSAELTLTPNPAYEARVVASNAFGFSPASPTVSFCVPAAGFACPVSNVTIGNVTATSVDVSWSQPVSSAPITDYRVSYRPSGTSTWLQATRTPSQTTSQTVTGLLPSKTYQFQVSAVTTSAGPESVAKLVTTKSGTPSTPSTVTAGSVRATSVALSWSPSTAPGSVVTDYTIQYRPSSSTTWLTYNDGVSTQTTATVVNLVPSTSYQFRVSGISPVRSGSWSTALSASTLNGVPAAPASVTTASKSATSVSLAWNAPSANGADISDYVVEYKRASAATWTVFNDGVSTNTSTTVTGLSASASYNFRISARTPVATGTSSAVLATSTLSGKPGPVSSLTITPTSSTVNLTWVAATENGAPVVDYNIDYRISGTTTWTRFADGVKATPGATITGLIPGTMYNIRVSGVSSFGSGSTATSSTQTLAG